MDTDPTTRFGIDMVLGQGDPYYQTLGAPGSKGGFGSTPDGVSGMFDQPTENRFPKNSQTIRFDFEDHLFCAEGDDKGTFPGGKVVWKWEKTKGSAGNQGTATVVSVTRDKPTPGSAVLNALKLWEKNHATWVMPPAPPQPPGGEACN